MVWNKYPYTDFHEMNDDWVISTVKKLTEDWAATLTEWNDTKEEWQALYNYVHDYFDNLDVQDEINHKINQMILDGTFVTVTRPVIEAKVASMLPAEVSNQIGGVVANQIGGAVQSQIAGAVAVQIGTAVQSPVENWLNDNITQPTTPVVDATLSISTAAADAAVTGDNIRYLKRVANEEIPNVKNVIENGVNTFIPYLELGSIDLSSGNEISSSVRWRSDYFTPVGSPASFVIHAPSTVEIGRVYYNSGTYAAYYNWTAPGADGTINQTNSYDSYRIVVRHSDGTAVTDAEVAQVYITYAYSIDLNAVKPVEMHPMTKHSYRNDFVSGAYINGDDYTSNGAYRCLYLDVVPGDVFYVWGWMKYNFIHMVSIYDENDTMLVQYNIGGSDEIEYSETEIVVPATGAKMYVTAYVLDPQGFQFDFYKYEYGRVTQWNGKTASFVGDSITEGVYWDGASLVNTSYPFTFYLPDLMQLASVENKGASGATIADNPAHSAETWLWMKNRISGMTDTCNLAVMFAGTNDFGLDTPLGTIDSNDTTTFYGALNNIAGLMLNRFNQKYNRKKVVWMTPLHRLGDTTPNGAGLVLADYVEAMKKVASKYAIDLIDLYSCSGFTGISSLTDYTLLSSDGLHPTEILGYQRLAEVIADKLNSI